jgi:hypothetical protein
MPRSPCPAAWRRHRPPVLHCEVAGPGRGTTNAALNRPVSASSPEHVGTSATPAVDGDDGGVLLSTVSSDQVADQVAQPRRTHLSGRRPMTGPARPRAAAGAGRTAGSRGA